MIPFIGLIEEALRTFNNIYEDQPEAQRRAWAMFTYQTLFKPLIFPRLSDEQKKIIEEYEKNGGIMPEKRKQ